MANSERVSEILELKESIGNRQLYSIGGTWAETTQHVPVEMAFGGFFALQAEIYRPRHAGYFTGRLTEADGAQSIIQGYLDLGKWLVNFEKTYIDGRGCPRRAPINYSFSKNTDNDNELWKGNFFLHRGEEELLRMEGFEPNGRAFCRIQLIKDGVADVITLSKIPDNFEAQKLQLIANYLNKIQPQ
ncbi:MAG: hypothetical protein Q7R97_03470 [Candidatus Daviesbacteria bacterium]|nr:hypothetical protein [Candidatus Daviesbacteria bacterium]